jgi:hypothetical protein
MKKLIIATLLVLFLPFAPSAQVSFTASANKVVEIGENFRLNFTVNANGTNFSAPDLSAFHVLGGPSTSSSTSFQYINGKTSQTITNTYSYILQAKKEGKFIIGKADISVDGKTYSSEPISIEVIKGSSANITESDQGNVRPVEGLDIYVQTNLDKTTVYQGEQIIATLKVYDRAGLKGINNYKFPSFTGFYSQDVKLPSQISLDRENVGGKIYQTGILKQSILFPQQTGNLVIDPFELECIVQQKAGQRRNFFGELIDIYRDIPKTLRSGSRTVRVLPLPDGAPVSFNGAVGSNFQFNVSVDRSELKTNESISLKINLSGSGNLKIIDKINIQFPSSFEIYDPKISNNISNSGSGSKGNNIYEYLVIPREPGEYTIPPIEFSYFDVVSKTYKTLTSQEFRFKIEKGDNQDIVTSSGVSKELVKELGSDIRFISQNDFVLRKRDTTFFGSIHFYLFYILSFALFGISILVLRQRIKYNKNTSLLKNRRAGKISQKRLKIASVCMKNGEKQEFYDEVIKALWGYLSDKLNIPVANLSRDTVREALTKEKLENSLIEEFILVIDNCEFAKYAPVGGNAQIEQDFERAKRIINKLEQAL